MAWLRIEDTVPEHRKHLRAGPAASWLWVCGIAYCQRQLSDGFIPSEAVPLLGVPKGLKALLDKLVEVGLFDVVDGGYRVHDYHDYNSTREEALIHQEQQREAKSRAGKKGAAARWQKDGSVPLAADSRPMAAGYSTPMAPSHPIPSHPVQTPPVSVSTATDFTPEFGERVRAFVEGYAALYRQHRNGATYHARPSLDYQTACGLCRSFPDVERLLKLAAVFLTSDDDWIAKGTRSIQQFAARASWCDDKLREWEKTRGVA